MSGPRDYATPGGLETKEKTPMAHLAGVVAAVAQDN
jgi:hypothetical protein